MGGEGIVNRVWDQHIHTAIFKMGNQQGPTVYSTGNCLQCYEAAWMGVKFGGEKMYI